MINRIFMAMLLLSITGGFVSSFFLIMQKKIYQYTSANFVVTINTLVIFCFVFPFFKILSHFDQSSFLLKRGELIVWVEQGTTKYSLYSIMEKIHFADFITGLWVTGVLVYLLYETVTYFYFITFIRKRSEEISQGIWFTTYRELCKEYSIIKAIDLFYNKDIVQPCVAGMKKSMILIPYHLMEILEPDEIRIILSHELTHIKKRDLPFRIFISLLNSLNWCNPLFYLLKNNLEEWIELSCDEAVTANMNIAQKRAYIDVLIKLSDEQRKHCPKRAVLYFNNKNLRNIKRRVWGIMKKNNLGNKFSKVFIFTLLVGVIAGGGIIAKAADYPINEIFSNHLAVLESDNYSIEEIGESIGNTKFIHFDKENEVILQEDDNTPLSSFILDRDVTYEVIDSNSRSERLIQKTGSSIKYQHEYEKVNIKEHKKNDNGSCKETVYEGGKCSICCNIIKGEIISETTYKKCAH